MENKNKKIIIILVGILILLLGTSFAYITFQYISKNKYNITSGYLSLMFEEENSILLENVYPIKTEEGLELDPFIFSITNDGDKELSYSIYLIDNEIDSDMDENKERLESKYLDYNLICGDMNQSGYLSDLLTDDITIDGNIVEGIILDNGKIEKNETKEFLLRIWLDYNADNEAQGKVFSSKIYVLGEQIKDKILIYDDGTGANSPDIVTGMIPVVYDDVKESWVKADVSNKNNSWFDYAKQKWANVVTVKKKGIKSRVEYNLAPVGETIEMDDINTMWVWIPRYSYSIKSEDGVNYYGKGSTTNTLPGEIDVKFVDRYDKDTGTAKHLEEGKEDWFTHPAFTFGSDELSGIWVAKFETGGSNYLSTDAKKILIKPDIKSWKSINVSTAFQLSRNFENELDTFGFNNTADINMDSHMMKNDEWNSVAYLSQSKYGKYGNNNYVDTEKEVYINNGTYTGRSGGSYSGNTPINGTYTERSETTTYNSNGFYTYDDYLLDYDTGLKIVKVSGKGTGASTTGTIYGVYDMSGGGYEAVMGNFNKSSGETARYYTKEEAKEAGLNNGNYGVYSANSGFNGYVYGKDYNEETGLWDIEMYVMDGIDFPSTKYYNLYEFDGSFVTCSGRLCNGHIGEMSNWYNDRYNIERGNKGSAWIIRGGEYKSNSGVYALETHSGAQSLSISFRLVISNE